MLPLSDEYNRVETAVTREWAVSGLPADKLESSFHPFSLLYRFHSTACWVLTFHAEGRVKRAETVFGIVSRILKSIAECNPPDFTADELLSLARVHGVSSDPPRVMKWTAASYMGAIVSAWRASRVELLPFVNLLAAEGDDIQIRLGTVGEFAVDYAEFLADHPHWNDGIDLAWKDEDGNLLSGDEGTTPREDVGAPPENLPSTSKASKPRVRRPGTPRRKSPAWIDNWLNGDRRRKNYLIDVAGDSPTLWAEYIGCAKETVVKTKAYSEAIEVWTLRASSSVRTSNTTDPYKLGAMAVQGASPEFIESLGYDDTPENREWLSNPENLKAAQKGRDKR